ncbi:MAG: glycosyltransferase [Flavobacteriales bacterium]
MTPMKKEDAVLFLAGWWPSADDPNDGIFVKEHALAVHELVPVVVIHLRLNKVATGRFRIELTETNEDGIVVIRGEIQTAVRRFGLHNFLVRLAYRRALAMLSSRFRFRLAHIHVRTPMTENGVHLAVQEKLPVIITEHSTFYHRGISLQREAEQTQEVERISRWFAHPSIRMVLPVSQDLHEILHERFGIPTVKLRVIPNVASPVFIRRGRVETTPFCIVLAARWAGNKDPALFIEALHLLPELLRRTLSIQWVGDGEFIDETRAACAPYIQQGFMHFPGRLSKVELAPILAQAHLLVHPTKAENLPCIIIESLCCGTPVLSNAVNGVPELVDETNGRLTAPQDPVAFAHGLLWIMENYAHFDRDGIARAAQARYSAKAVAQQIVDVYDKVNT